MFGLPAIYSAQVTVKEVVHLPILLRLNLHKQRTYVVLELDDNTIVQLRTCMWHGPSLKWA